MAISPFVLYGRLANEGLRLAALAAGPGLLLRRPKLMTAVAVPARLRTLPSNTKVRPETKVATRPRRPLVLPEAYRRRPPTVAVLARPSRAFLRVAALESPVPEAVAEGPVLGKGPRVLAAT